MLVYLLRRLGQSLLVLLAVSFVAFLVFRYIGDPTLSLLGEDATLEERQALTEQLGFNQPVPLQYVAYLRQLAQGELGVSYRLKRPVTEVIGERLLLCADSSHGLDITILTHAACNCRACIFG